jgi:hypothetical protein
MSGETVWQGLAAILPIFHWKVLGLGAKNALFSDDPFSLPLFSDAPFSLPQGWERHPVVVVEHESAFVGKAAPHVLAHLGRRRDGVEHRATVERQSGEPPAPGPISIPTQADPPGKWGHRTAAST